MPQGPRRFRRRRRRLSDELRSFALALLVGLLTMGVVASAMAVICMIVMRSGLGMSV